MATKAPAKAPAKKTGTALVPWEAAMAARAAKAKQQEKPVVSGVRSIAHRGGFLKIEDDLIEGNTLDIIVLASVHENTFYEGAFDPDNPAPPVCYAFSDPESEDPEDGMAPHEKAESPQHEDCHTCPMNQFGSADRGRGKACKNVRRLMVVTADAAESAEDMLAADMRRLSIPVMSVGGWSKLVNRLADEMERDPSMVVLRLSTKPDPKSQYRLVFEFESLIEFDQDLWEALEKRRAEAIEQLVQPYPTAEEMEERAASRAAENAPKGRTMKPAGRVAAKAVGAGKGKVATRGKF